MPDDIQTPAAATTPEGGAPAVEPAAQAAAAPVQPVVPSSSVVHLTSTALQRRVREEREKGRRGALSELDAAAREAGFGSHKEFLSYVASERKEREAARAAATAEPADKGARPDKRAAQALDRENQEQARKARRDNERRERELDTLRQENKKARRQAAQLQRERDAIQAEANLRSVASSVGITDEDGQDFALLRLKKAFASLSEADQEKFDEAKFFQDLKAKAPQLFRETKVLANTGAAATTPAKSNTGPTVTPTGGDQISVAKMDDRQLAEYLRKRGINPNYSVNLTMPSLPNGGRGGAKA